MPSVGINIPEETLERLEKRKQQLDRLESRSISRSEAARPALDVGLAAMQVLEDEGVEPMRDRERRHLVKQAIREHFNPKLLEQDPDVEAVVMRDE